MCRNSAIVFYGNQVVCRLWQVFHGITVWISVSASMAESHQLLSAQLHLFSLFLETNAGVWCTHCYLWRVFMWVCFKGLLLSSSAVIHSFMTAASVALSLSMSLCVYVCWFGFLVYRETKTIRKWEWKWMNQLKAIERSKASIKMSSVSCHINICIHI